MLDQCIFLVPLIALPSDDRRGWNVQFTSHPIRSYSNDHYFLELGFFFSMRVTSSRVWKGFNKHPFI